jgi:hypothetical protein
MANAFALSPQGFGQGITTGVSDIFAGFGDEAKAKMDLDEQQEYQLASRLATQNEQFTQMSTAIQEAQESREITQALGKTTAQVAGAGFAESGSAIDILRSGAQQGAQAQAVLSEQGLITEAGYKEQAQSYDLMASAAGTAASAEKTAAIGSFIAGGLSLAGAALSLPFAAAAAAGPEAGAVAGGAAGGISAP